MQIIWLKAFIALAESRNFSEAAEEIYVSQSSLSKYIQALEKVVGFKLFDRSHRIVELTAAGVALYRYAVDIVSRYDDMMTAMSEFACQDKNKIQLATVSAAHMFGYSTLFYKFHKDHPEINFSMREMEMQESVRELAAGNVDFAVVRTNLLPDAELQKYQELLLNVENMYLICSTSHYFAARDHVSLKEIQKSPLIMTNFAQDELPLIFQKYHMPDLPLDIIATSSRTELLVEYLKANMGVGFVSRPLGESMTRSGDLVLIPIDEKPVITLGVLARKGKMNPECTIFWNYMKDMAEKHITADPELEYLVDIS